jgi:outer membrane protein OmpA-like peptidoglycan-associated protein
MADTSQIREHMPVIASDGRRVGTVDAAGPDGIKLTRNDSPDGQHHLIPLAWVARVDEHVHLTHGHDEVIAGWGTLAASDAGGAAHATHGISTLTQAVAPVHHDERRGPNWLAWALLLAGLLALLFVGARGCSPEPRTEANTGAVSTTTTATTASGAAAATPALPVEQVTLPGGRTVALEGGSIGYALQRYLASPDPAPRSFTFDRLNFDTGSAEIRAQDRPTIDALRQILAAYPDARVRIVGYTDARGDAGANDDLGARRARAVAQALTGEGVVAARIESATGGETNPADTNATAQGQFDNRRTELVVLAK